MENTEQAGGGYSRGRNVGLWLPPEDYARLQAWGAARYRKVAASARLIILERLAADELAESTEQREHDRIEGSARR